MMSFYFLQLEPRIIENPSWVVVLFVVSFLVLVVTKVAYPNRFSEFLLLPLTDRYFALEGKLENIFHPFNILLFFFQAISISFFIFLLKNSFQTGIDYHQWMVFLQLFLGFIIFVTFKIYVEKLVAHIFNIELIINRFLYEKVTYLSLLSLLLWMGSMVLYFSIPNNTRIIYALVIVTVVLYGVSIFSSIKRNSKPIFKNFFYFILYLCALEIAPYVILYKVFV